MKQKRQHFLSGRKQVLIMSILLIYLFYTVYAYAMDNLERISNQYAYQLMETGQQIAGEINGRMRDAIVVVESLAITYSRFEDIHDEEAVIQLQQISEKTDFTRMWLTKLDGVAVSSEGIKTDASGRAYLAEAGKGNSGISNVQTSRVNGEKNVVVYAPIYHDGEITGVLIGIYALDRLADLVDISCYDGKGSGKIFDQSGTILVREKDDLMLSEWDNLLSFWKTVEFQDGKDLDDIRRSLVKQEAVSLLYTLDMQKHDGYFCPIGVNDWFIYVSLPNEFITAYTTENIKAAAMLCVKFVVVLILVLVYRYQDKNRKLREQAQIDGLTQLYNRRTAEEKIRKLLENMVTNTGALILFDIDKFKVVNDTYGHAAGDELLKKIAYQMKHHFEGDGVLGRFGGDEFIIYIPVVENREILLKRARKFVKTVNRIRLEEYPDIAFSVSMGITFVDAENNHFREIYETADERLYFAKRNGGNKVAE